MTKSYNDPQSTGVSENGSEAWKNEKSMVSPEIIRNILAFSRSLKVEKTKTLGKIVRVMN